MRAVVDGTCAIINMSLLYDCTRDQRVAFHNDNDYIALVSTERKTHRSYLLPARWGDLFAS